MIGAFLLAVGLLASASDDLTRSSLKLTPTAAMYSSGALPRAFAAIRLGVPTVVAIGVGAVLAMMLTSPLVVIGGAASPVGVLGGIAVAAALAAVALWASIVSECGRLQRRWSGRGLRQS